MFNLILAFSGNDILSFSKESDEYENTQIIPLWSG